MICFPIIIVIFEKAINLHNEVFQTDFEIKKNAIQRIESTVYIDMNILTTLN